MYSDGSDKEDQEKQAAIRSITNNRAPLMTRFDDIVEPEPKVYSS